MSTKRIATLNRGRGGAGYRRKRCFLKLRKDADRKRLFCSNVSTLLSMIVAPETFRAHKAIFSSSVFKNREVYTSETSCMKRTCVHIKNK